MPSDAWPNKPPNKSLESTKETFKKRLDGILYEQLNVENIEYFASDALNKTIHLTDDILKEYKDNPSFNANLNLSTHEQEDEAFKTLELPNIQEILQSIIEVKDKIASLKEYLETNAEFSNKVITPPGESKARILPGESNFEEKRIFPRLLTLMYILEHDFEIQKETVKITEGKVTPDMMRQTPYVRIEIPDLERTIYICDEEGNASYIFDSSMLSKNGISIEEMDLYDKEEKNSLIAKYPGIGARFIQTKNWRNVVKKILEEIPQNEKKIKEVLEEKTEKKSEFKEKREYPLFEVFQAEVRAVYPGKGNVQVWFHKERKNYPNWPSNPSVYYKNSGWTDWSDLVGKENHLKKEWLPFDKFHNEVRSLYSGEKNVARWYERVRATHSDWPKKPGHTYKGKGWIGWPELVGRENMFKREYPDFENFKMEVRLLYLGQGNVENWYHIEREKHPNWPKDPDYAYKNIGWQGWPELVGRENMLKKEWLPFENFREEVRTLYPGKGGVQLWYNQEQKNHKNWPSAPDQMYKNQGWVDWSDLAGKENLFKRERLDFNAFQAEVRSLFPGKGMVNEWYKKERKNHPTWPSNPDQFYKGKGWIGWPELVGKENRLKKNK